MPLCLGQAAASSADISATGIKKVNAAKIKKKISELPNRAVAGKFRMLSIETVISMTSAKIEMPVVLLGWVIVSSQLKIVKRFEYK